MKNRQKLLEELETFNNIIRGFCEKFDCEDLLCTSCPVGVDVCLALGKDNVEKKMTFTTLATVFTFAYWKEIVIIILSAGLLSKLAGWW